MNCFGVRKRLLDYVEAERDRRRASPLPDQSARAIEAHLDGCPRCREEAEAIRTTLTVADMAGDVEPGAAFKLRTVRLLKQEAERVPARTPFAVRFRPALACAAVVLLLGVLLVIFVPERGVRVELAVGTGEFEEQVEQYAREIEFLAGTLSGSGNEFTSYVERVHLDKIELLASSIDECWDAFEENPENSRIKGLILAQMREEVDTLKSFHEVRSL